MYLNSKKCEKVNCIINYFNNSFQTIMARSSPKKSRSASRGRSASAKKSPKKTPAKKTPAKRSASAKKTTPAKPTHKMDFSEGDNVMARWPGTSLYFKAKVNYVRDDDNEYDVQYEDGTVFTIKAKDVRARVSEKKSRSRSRSRGRSPARKTRATPKSTPKATPKATPKSAVAVRAPRPDPTPTRSSARLAAAKIELSSDEDDGPKAIPNPSHPKKSKRGLFPSINLTWVQPLFFMFFCPLVLISLHELCKNNSCKLQMPKLSTDWKHYWNKDAFVATFVFCTILRLFAFLPVGARVRSASGKEVRLNGFLTLLAMLAVVPALIYKKMNFSFVSDNYFHLMTSSIIMSGMSAKLSYFMARFWGKKSNVNPKGNTGNIFVDIYNGREFNPHYFKVDLKLQVFRTSMIALAMINVCLIVHNVNQNLGKVNLAVAMTAVFQVIYALDAMFFEEYFFFSHDAMNTGFGFNLISSYLTFPFIPTLVTRYMIAKNPTLTTFHLVAIGFMNLFGYVIFRASETQR